MKNITFKDLSKSFGDVLALKEINLEISEGEFIALIGPSGCGKTTLLRLALGLIEPTTGEVLLGNRKPQDVRRERDFGFVFQKAALVPSKTALQNVQMTLDIAKVDNPLDPVKILADFGLKGFENHYPHQLSGGMQQRVNIAAAMVHNPHFMMMDEPFGALDEMTKETMAEWLGDILIANTKTTILITHSIEEAVMLADRIVILGASPGRISSIVSVELPRPRKRHLKTTEEFGDLVLQVRRKLYAVENTEEPV